MKLFSFFLIMIVFMGALFGPKFKDYETSWSAVVYWRDKDKDRQKTSAEVSEFVSQIDKKIDEYLSKNSHLSEKIKEELKIFRAVHKGMNKEQVLLLLGEPPKKEPVSEYGADEKWIYITYHPYAENHLYFKGDVVIKILGFQTGNVL